MGNAGKITLTPEQERWLERHFKHTRNAEAAEKAENVISQIVIAKGVRFPGREHDYGVRKSLREVHGGFPVSDEFRKEEDD